MLLLHLVILAIRVVSHQRVAKLDQMEEVQSINSSPSEAGFVSVARTKGKQLCDVEGRKASSNDCWVKNCSSTMS
jgi:hypothetical protein